MSTATRPPAMQHYQNAIEALSDGEYNDLSEEERQSLLRVLRQEKQRLLQKTEASPSRRSRS